MPRVFEGFELDEEGCRVLRAGAEVPLERRAFELLQFFVARPGRLIRKQELVAEVWRMRALSDGVLANTVTKLRKALGQAPDAREPLETVRGRGYVWHARPSPEASAEPQGRERFVARAVQLAQLIGILDLNPGTCALVTGDAGIGKTRVLRELEKRALERGFQVLWGAGYDGAALPAFWPWVEVLRAAHAWLGASGWRRCLPARHDALAQLVPELCAPQPAAADGMHTRRFALFDELTRLLDAACAQTPLLILLDDLHGSDAGSIELLAYASRTLARRPVRFVAALRERDVSWQPAQQAALQRLARLSTSVALPGLGRDEVLDLVAQLAGPCEPAFVDRVFAVTQGNPLFVREMLGLLQQRDAHALCPEDLPPAVRSVIAQRIQLLPEATRRVLCAAAVVGRDFAAPELACLAQLPLERVLHLLEPAAATGVIRPSSPPAAHGFTFTHELVRDALYAALSAAERGGLHAALARARIARGASCDGRELAAIAHHSLLAVPSELAQCLAYGQAAAAAARASSGFEAAASILAQCLHKHERESSQLSERCELMLVLASDLACAGDMRAAWQVLQRGAELARQLSAAELLARFASGLAPWLEHGGGDERYIRQLQRDALQALGERAPELRASLLAERAWVEVDEPGELRAAWLDEAERLATGDAARRVGYVRAVMRGPIRVRETHAAVQRFRARACPQDGGHAHPLRVQDAFYVELAAYANALAACDLSEAETAAVRCRELARHASTMSMTFLIALLDAGRAHASADLQALEACVQRLREAERMGGGFGLAWQRYGLLLAHERGELAALLRRVPAADYPPLDALPRHAHAQANLFLAWLHVQAEDPVRARSRLSQVPSALLARMPLQRDDLSGLCMLAEVYRYLGERAGAERLLEQLEPYAELNALGPTYDYAGSVAHYLGVLAALLGRSASAAAHFERAIVVNRRLGMPRQLARTHAERAAARR